MSPQFIGGSGFSGTALIIKKFKDADMTVYLTKHRRIAVTVVATESLHVYENFQEFASDWQEKDPVFVGLIASVLREQHIIDLDI
jgi:hypothetical protein